MNTQPIWPIESKTQDGQTLNVHSIFYTIQGEGPFAGQPAVFIRLAGCNLQCPMCDTDYTGKHKRMTVQEIVSDVIYKGIGTAILVVITGGEPLRQSLGPLIKKLLNKYYRVQLETNGTLFQELPWERITTVCSPKAGKIHRSLVPWLNALKYVGAADDLSLDDGLPTKALEHPNSPILARPPMGFHGKIYLQPIDVGDEGENKRHLAACVKSCMTFGYNLCLQQHKIIGVE